MSTKKKTRTKPENKKDFEKEYEEIFSIIGKSANEIEHEWNVEGDVIKEFTLFEEHKKTILTNNILSC